MIISLIYRKCYHVTYRMMLLSLMFSTLRVPLVFGMKLLVMLTCGQMEEKTKRREFTQTDTKLRYIFSQEPLSNQMDANTQHGSVMTNLPLMNGKLGQKMIIVDTVEVSSAIMSVVMVVADHDLERTKMARSSNHEDVSS